MGSTPPRVELPPPRGNMDQPLTRAPNAAAGSRGGCPAPIPASAADGGARRVCRRRLIGGRMPRFCRPCWWDTKFEQ